MAVQKIDEANLFSISRLAELFGHTRETIGKKLKDGGAMPAGKRAGYATFRLRDVASFTGGLPTIEQTPFEQCDPDKLPPKDRDAWYSSENKRLQFQTKEGQLLDRDETQQLLAETLKKVALTFDTLADVMERDVGLSPEQIKKVNEVADNIREDLAKDLLKMVDS